MAEGRPDRSAALAELAARFGADLSTLETVRRYHGTSEGFYPIMAPDAVLTARSTQDVADAMSICARHGVPVIPFGAGSSVEGHILAPCGGVTINLSEMNAILDISPLDQDARVQAGVTRKQLNASLRDQGLFFPVDPGADATLGGMVSTRASGTTTVRYGGIRANILGLTVVLPSGQVITTGGRARKSSAGYDLTSLFTGAEGTLGIVTEVQVRLHGVPEEVAAMVCDFPDVKSAVEAVIDGVQYGLPMARSELLDAHMMGAINAYSRLDYPQKPHLFLEFHGGPEAVREQVAAFEEIAAARGGRAFRSATAQERRDELWAARHNAYFAALALARGKSALITDACVPVSTLADCIVETQADIAAAGLIGPVLGHVGDGNFHALVMIDGEDANEVVRARGIVDRLVTRSLAVGGTCTGEHGVGMGKRGQLRREHGEAVDLMAAIKQVIDPQNIMNPGKLVSDSNLNLTR